MTALASEVLEFPSVLTRAREGDQDAFAALVEQHESMVFSIAWNFFGDRARAEEIAQEAFLGLYRHLDSLESESHVIFWLRQVTTRKCIDQTRRNRMRAVSLEDAGEIKAHEPDFDPLRDQTLRRSIAELPEMQRAIVTLRYQEDLGPSEICEIVGLPVNTVKSHLHRALQSLRRKLERHS